MAYMTYSRTMGCFLLALGNAIIIIIIIIALSTHDATTIAQMPLRVAI